VTSRKTLQDFFKAARQQQPPIQPADVLRKTIVRQTVRWHTGSVISVAGVVAAGIAAVAVSLLLPNQTSVTVSRSAEQHAAPLVSPTADHEQAFSVRQPAAAIVRPAYSSTKRKSAVLSRPVQPATTPLCMHGDHDLNLSALFADSEVLRSLTIEPSAVDIICSSLSSADSLTNCTTGGTETSVQMCVFRNGNGDVRQVPFMYNRGPIPVMFTSADGRGRIVTSDYSGEIDPNKLVPVVAKSHNQNVLMWYRPTTDFVCSLPDSVAFNMIHFVNNTVSVRIKLLHATEVDSDPGLGNGHIIPLAVANGIPVPASTISTPRLQESRLHDGALLSSMVYPNPSATGTCAVQFSLAEPRVVNIALLDLRGTIVRQLRQDTTVEAGVSTLDCSVQGLPAGMYLLSLVTNANERVVRRFIIQ